MNNALIDPQTFVTFVIACAPFMVAAGPASAGLALAKEASRDDAILLALVGELLSIGGFALLIMFPERLIDNPTLALLVYLIVMVAVLGMSVAIVCAALRGPNP